MKLERRFKKIVLFLGVVILFFLLPWLWFNVPVFIQYIKNDFKDFPRITIVNEHSSPKQEESWIVEFKTVGRSDLYIRPNDDATVADDEFLGLYCDSKKRTPQILEGDVIYYPNWFCNGSASVEHFTRKSGHHTLRFEFAGDSVLAYNSPVATNRTSEQSITDLLIDATLEYSPSPNIVFTSANTGYLFYIGGSALHASKKEVMYKKTTDGGQTWSGGIIVPGNYQEGVSTVSVWYDQWTPGDSGTKIHIATGDITSDDVWYRYLDTTNDSIRAGGWVSAVPGTAFTGNGTAAGAQITKSSDGNLFIGACGTFTSVRCAIYKSTDDGDAWSDTSFTISAGTGALDFFQILPLSGGDILTIFQDTSADNVVSKEYDEDIDSWGNEQTIDASWVDNTTYDTPWGASLLKSTGDVYLAGMNAIDSTSGDLEAYKFDDGTRTWSTLTEIISNHSETLQGTMVLDQTTGDIYAVYINCTPIASDCTVRYKVSEDDGNTWSPPVQISDNADDTKNVRTSLMTVSNKFYVNWYNDDLNEINGNQVDTTATTVSAYTVDGSILSALSQGSPSPNVAFVDANTGYLFYVDASSDVVYRKTADGGKSWSTPTVLGPDKTWSALAIWYDGWTANDTGSLIHIAAIETVTDDLWYYSLDTDTDTLDGDGWTATALGTVFDSATSDGPPSIVKNTAGNLFIAGCGTFGTTRCVIYKSSDGNSWSDTSFSAASGLDDNDWLQLLPTGSDDIVAIMQDATQNKVISVEYLEASDTWSNEQTIDSSWIENASFDAMWGASYATSTGDIYLVGMNALNSATGDLETYKFTGSSRTWSNLTDVVTDSDSTLQGTISVDSATGDLYAVYVQGYTDAANAYNTNVYVKTSEDDGTTWSSATKLNTVAGDIRNVNVNMAANNVVYANWFNTNLNDILGRAVDPGVVLNPGDSMTFVVSTDVFPSLIAGTYVFATSTLNMNTTNAGGWYVTLSGDDKTDVDTVMDLDTDANTGITDQTEWIPGVATTSAGNAVARASLDNSGDVLAFRVMTASGSAPFISTSWWGSDDSSGNALWAGIASTTATDLKVGNAGDGSYQSGDHLNTVQYYLDVPLSQQTGDYSCPLTYTATAN